MYDSKSDQLPGVRGDNCVSSTGLQEKDHIPQYWFQCHRFCCPGFSPQHPSNHVLVVSSLYRSLEMDIMVGGARFGRVVFSSGVKEGTVGLTRRAGGLPTSGRSSVTGCCIVRPSSALLHSLAERSRGEQEGWALVHPRWLLPIFSSLPLELCDSVLPC